MDLDPFEFIWDDPSEAAGGGGLNVGPVDYEGLRQPGLDPDEFVWDDPQEAHPDDIGSTSFGDYGRKVAIGLDRFGATLGRGLDIAGFDDTGEWIENYYTQRAEQKRSELSPAMKAEEAKKFLEYNEEGQISGIGEGAYSVPKILCMVAESLPATGAGI